MPIEYKKPAYFGSELVEVVSVNGGWSEIRFPNDAGRRGTQKVRNGRLSYVAPVTPPKQVFEPVKTVPVAPKQPAEPAPDADPEEKFGKIGTSIFKLSRFKTSEIKTASGRKTFDVADDVAVKFRTLTLNEVYLETSAKTGVPVGDLMATYGHLNPGMQRMNLGNKHRAFDSSRLRLQALAAEKERRAASIARQKALREQQRIVDKELGRRKDRPGRKAR